MYGTTRATMTLIGAGVAGFLVWLATNFSHRTTGGYWAILGVIAGAGLVMALAQLLGGWTKWGVPHLSPPVFLLGFLPVLIVAGWVIVAGEPHGNWARDHVLAWSSDIHVRGLVNDLLRYLPVLAFGTGLTFGFSFDTTGPRRREPVVTDERRTTVDHPVDRHATDAPLTAERNAVGTTPARDEHLVGAGTPTGTSLDRDVQIREGGTPMAPLPTSREDDPPA